MLPIRGHRSDPRSGNEDPCGVVWPKGITIMELEIVCLTPLCTYQRSTLAAVSLTERNPRGFSRFIENEVKREALGSAWVLRSPHRGAPALRGGPAPLTSGNQPHLQLQSSHPSVHEPLSLTCIYSVASSEGSMPKVTASPRRSLQLRNVSREPWLSDSGRPLQCVQAFVAQKGTSP